jgi:hypothetical protein
MATLPRSPVNGNRPFRMIAGVSTLSDLADGQSVGWGYPGAGYGGKQYYVNNITGSSTADGSDWEHAMDEVNTAIIASEAYRKAQWYSSGTLLGARYQTIRNQIFVQGTGTYYDAIDYSTNGCDPHHTDIIGLGDNVEANGDGQVQIGSSTTNTKALHTATNTSTGEPGMFGTRWYNIKFLGGGAAAYAVELGKVRGVGFYNCNFNVNAASLGCFLADEMFAGSTIAHCTFANNAGGTVPVRCMYISGSGTHTDNRIYDNIFYSASTAHITFEGGLSWGTVFSNNFFIGVAANSCVDTSTYGAFWAGNYYTPATTYELASTVTTMYAGNMVAAGAVTVNT